MKEFKIIIDCDIDKNNVFYGLKLNHCTETLNLLNEIYDCQDECKIIFHSDKILNYDSASTMYIGEQKSNAATFMIADLKQENSFLYKVVYKNYQKTMAHEMDNFSERNIWIEFAFDLFKKIIEKSPMFDNKSVGITAFTFDREWYFTFRIPEEKIRASLENSGNDFLKTHCVGCRLIDLGWKNIFEYALCDYYSDLASDGDHDNAKYKDLMSFNISLS